MIRPTEIEQDLSSVLEAIEPVRELLRERGQLSVTSRPGAEDQLTDALGWLPEDAQEADYSVVNDAFRGGAIEQLIEKLDFQYGRIRLMRLAPKSCLSVHADSTRRYHYAIVTTPDCYLVEMHGDQGKFHHIPADGRLYEMDARITHTALNSGRSERIHLVVCNADEHQALEKDRVGRVHGVTSGKQTAA